MDLNQQIRSNFAASNPGDALLLQGLAEDYMAWTIRMDGEYGVAVPLPEEVQISERFSSVRLWSSSMYVDKKPYNLLLLTCNEERLRLEFSSICAQFVDPGNNGESRRLLINSPIEWWRAWRDLLGNSIKEKTPHGVLGELLTLIYLLENGGKPDWTGPKNGVVDVICGNSEYEVKSTTMRYDSIITISGQFQLQRESSNALSLIFCRFEETSSGTTIDDVIHRLVASGYDRASLEKAMNKLGLEAGCSDRKRIYKLLEMRQYSIDEDFPRITAASFVGGKIPAAVVQITYRLDLTGLEYDQLELRVQ
jgi:hypothetical protein